MIMYQECVSEILNLFSAADGETKLRITLNYVYSHSIFITHWGVPESNCSNNANINSVVVLKPIQAGIGDIR